MSEKFFRHVPLPIAGLMLGMAGLGNLIEAYGSHYRYLVGLLSLLIGILLVVRLYFDFQGIREDLEDPLKASVSLTFSMAVIILASYLLNISYPLAVAIWYGGIVLHLLLAVLFSLKFLPGLSLEQVFPSYFIVYVGIVVASVSAPAFERFLVGQYLFWLGFAGYMFFLPVVSYRIFRLGELKKPALPTLSIFTAPAGLCLAGYISAFAEYNILMLGWLSFLTLISITGVIIYLPEMLSVGFNSGFSAFTFPYIITAIGLKSVSEHLTERFAFFILRVPARAVEVLAIILSIYVFIRYVIFLFKIRRQQSYQRSET